MIRRTIAAALLVSAAPLAAQQPAPASHAQGSQVPGSQAPAAAPDPARVAAARRFVDAALPSGLFEQALIAGVRAAGEQRRGDAAASRRDPHHAERVRIEQRVMEEETTRIMRDIDPGLRAAFADSYARALTADELQQSAAFYESAAGRRFAAGALTVAMSADYQRSMEALDPTFKAVAAGADQRFAAATAGMPPIPGMPTPPRAGTAPPATVAPPAVALPARSGPPADPARVAAARRALDALWPSELFRHNYNLLPAAETLLAIRVGDFGIPLPPSANINPNATLDELAGGFDPHLRQRLPVLSRFFGSEMLRLTAAMEPGWKMLTADAYAREFSAAELDEVTRFFTTPAGRRIAGESYRLVEDPQLVRSMVMMIPRVVMQIPAMTQRVQQATAHLPAPPAAAAETAPPRRGEAPRRRGRN